jgi:hypothetical protein
MRAKIDELETRLENLPEMKRRLSELAELIKQAVSEQPTPQSPSTEQESGETVDQHHRAAAEGMDQARDIGNMTFAEINKDVDLTGFSGSPNGSTEQPAPETD